jgi:hypothetical protein
MLPMRKLTRALSGGVIAALAGLVLGALDRSAGQLRALLPSAATSSAIAARAAHGEEPRSDPDASSTPLESRADSVPSLAQAPAAEIVHGLDARGGSDEADTAADAPDLGYDESDSGPESGPLGGAEFARLLESGVVPADDPAAAAELRRALREAAAAAAE